MENKSQTIVLSLKYVLLAILTGVLVGIIDTVFGRGLLTISDFRTGHYLYLIPFLPFAGLLITWLYYHFSETSLKGMTLVFETGQKKREDIPLLLIPLVMSGTWITHLFGGSAGREGVAVQIGAVLLPIHWGWKNYMCRLRIHLRYQMLVWLSGSLCLESFLD